MTATSVFEHPVAWWGPEAGNLFTGEPVPVDGAVTLSDAPGFGVELLRDRLVRPFARESGLSAANAVANIRFDEREPARARSQQLLERDEKIASLEAELARVAAELDAAKAAGLQDFFL